MNTNFRQLLNAGLNPCNATPSRPRESFPKTAASPVPHLGLRARFLHDHPDIIRKTTEAIDLLRLTGESLSWAAVNNIDKAFHHACLDAGLSAQDYPLNLPEAGRRFVTRLVRSRVALLETEPVSLRVEPKGIKQAVVPFETLSSRFPPEFSAPMKMHSRAQAPSSRPGFAPSDLPRSLVVHCHEGRKYVELHHARIYLVEADIPRDRTVQAAPWGAEYQPSRSKPMQAISPKLTPRKKDAGETPQWDGTSAGDPIAALRVDNDASHFSAELSALLRAMQVRLHARESWFSNARLERLFQSLDHAGLSSRLRPAASPRPNGASAGPTVTPLRPPTSPRRPQSRG